jgi:hypothetical protein
MYFSLCAVCQNFLIMCSLCQIRLLLPFPEGFSHKYIISLLIYSKSALRLRYFVIFEGEREILVSYNHGTEARHVAFVDSHA